MPRYRYTATDGSGHRLTDELEASGPEQAASYLKSVGYEVESVELADPLPHAAGRNGDGGRLSDQEIADFTRHVAGLNEAGLPLPAGLRALGAELATGPLRRVLDALATQLEAGRSLGDAVEEQGHRFPAHLRGLVVAGVKSGRLGEVLEQFTRYYQLSVDLKRKLWLSLAYPLMLLSMMSVLFVFVSMVVVRQFVQIYADFGMDLPGMTKLVISVSRTVVEFGPLLALGTVGALAVLWVVGVMVGGGTWKRSITSQIPLIGPLWRWTALVEFCHLLGLLLESEIALPAALQMAGDGLRDSNLARACRSMRLEVEAGQSLAECLSHVTMFPAGLARILRWAEGHESLPGALHLAGDMFEARARAQATFVGVACSVLAVILVLWGMAIVVVALFLPLIQLISKLSG
jgi:type II secretory pathway component PulF